MNGTGWPENEDAYNQHANVKLTQEQKDYIAESGESESEWIRGAVQERIDTEAHYRRANERAHRNTIRTYRPTESDQRDGASDSARE